MNLGERIYALRNQAHLSQGDLAEALEVSRQSVSKWENGNAVPDLDKLIKMADIFHVSLDALAGREAPPVQSSPPPPAPSVRKLLGIVLLGAGLLCLPFALIASRSDTQASLMVAGCFLGLSGAFTIAFPYPYVGIGWTALGAGTLLFFILTPRWEQAWFGQLLIWLSTAAMVCLTVRAHQSGKCHIPHWLWWLGGLVLCGLGILYCLNIIPR